MKSREDNSVPVRDGSTEPPDARDNGWLDLVRRKFKLGLRLLVDPFSPVQDKIQEKRSQLLAGILLFVVFLQIVSLGTTIQVPDSIPLYFYVAIFLNGIAYLISRTRNFQFGALLWAIVTSMTTFFAVYDGESMGNPEIDFAFLVFSALVPALVVGPMIVLSISVFNVTGILLFHLGVIEMIGAPDFTRVLIMNIAAAVIITGLIYCRNYIAEIRQKSFQESEQNLSSVTMNMRDGLFINCEGKHVFVNESMARMLEYSDVSELIGSTVEDFVHPDELETIEKHHHSRLEGKDVESQYEAIFITKTGEPLSVEINVDQTVWKGKQATLVTVRNIGERKKSEMQLRESQEQLKEAQRIAHVGSWEWIAETDTPTWSEELCAILEVDPNKPVPTVEEQENIYTPDSIVRMNSAIKTTMQTGESYELELERVREDGSRKWLLARGEPWFDEKGNLKGLRGTALDITARKQAEEQLRQINDQLRTSIENMPNAYILWDQDLHVIEWNKAAEEIFGYSKQEMLGKNPVNYIVPKPVRHLVEDVLKELEVGKVVGYSEKDNNIRKDGESISCQWFNTPLTDNNGDVSCILTIAQDITARLNADEALRVSEERYRRAERGTNDGLWEWNILTGEDYFSPRWLAMLGYEPGELAYHVDTFIDLIHPDDKPLVQTAMENHLQNDAPFDIEIRLREKNGEYLWVQSRGLAEKNENGEPGIMSGTISNISERKQSENEIQALSILNDNIVSESPIGLAIYDHTGQCIAANASVAEMIGATQEQMLSQNYNHIESWKKSGLLEAAIRSVRDQKKERHEFDVLTTFGKRAYFDCLFVPLTINGRQQLLLMFDDISERKDAENSLVTSERLLEKAQEMAKVGHWKLRLSNSEVSGSKELFDIFELGADEATLENFIAVIHPEDRELVTNVIQKAAETGQGWDIEYRVVTFKGNEKWSRGKGEVEVNESGEPEFLVGVVQDITEYKQTRQALRDSELWLENMYNSLEEAVLVVSPDRKIKSANHAALDMFGYSMNEIMTGSTELFHVDHQHFLEFGDRINQSFSQNQTANFEFVAKRKNGEIFPSEHTVSILKDSEGSVKGIVSVVRDITERRNDEAELTKHRDHLEDLVIERTQELHSAQQELIRKERLATLGQLTATVSHELRNPLGAMRPPLYMIKKFLGENANDKIVNAIDRLDRSVMRCDHIIDELLDFTRITELDRHATRVDDWLESVIDEQVVPDGVKLQKEFSLKDVKLNIDIDRMRRAVINVFENACHSMLDDNQKLVAEKNALLGIKTQENNQRIEIIISDTGAGISDEVMGKIFEPLFSTKGFGVGLGMSAVKQIVEQHGGGIEISTEVNKGTSTTLWLPISSVV